MNQIQSQWKRRALALAISAIIAGRVFALQPISDEDLSESVGEGIAFLPENASVRMNGADTANGGAGTFDTGYIRYIPVGPLTTAAASAGAGKGDIFLYGLAISQSTKNHGASRTTADANTRFNRTIDSWGTAENPWLLKVETEAGVPDFAAATPTATSNGSVSYLTLEAPLYHKNIGALSASEKSAYNLKMAYWADAFVRDPSVVESLTTTGSQFNLGGAGRANRLRLQAIWDGFSINGTNLSIFQTLGGASTGIQGMSSSYNNTLGISGTLRFNSGDASTLRATTTQSAPSTRTTSGWVTTWDASRHQNVTGPQNYTDTSGTAGGATSAGCNAGTTAHQNVNSSCRMQFQTRLTTDTATSATWTAPTTPSVFRFSTRETTNSNLLSTPAINGGSAPVFDQSEGIFLYNLNVNVVLGQLYQPLVVAVAPDGQNIVMELARIPNKQSIYKQLYTNYANSNPATNGGYYGSTCNVNKCGSDETVTYQGTNATHSSITIGSTEYNAATNVTTAHKGAGSIGVSFGGLPTGTQTATTAAQSFRDVQQRTRSVNESWLGDSWNGWGGWSNLAIGSSARYNLSTYSPNTWTQQAALSVPASAAIPVPSNNLGSAAIDGLLIQHMKFTTKGL